MDDQLWANDRKYIPMREDYEMSNKGTPPTKPTRKVKADVSKAVLKASARLNGPGRERRVPFQRSGATGDWPTDLPVLVEVERVLGIFKHPEAGDAEGVMGYIMEMEFPIHGLNLTAKLYRDPRNIIIYANGIEVYRGAGALRPAKPGGVVPRPATVVVDDEVLEDDEELLDDEELIFED